MYNANSLTATTLCVRISFDQLLSSVDIGVCFCVIDKNRWNRVFMVVWHENKQVGKLIPFWRGLACHADWLHDIPVTFRGNTFRVSITLNRYVNSSLMAKLKLTGLRAHIRSSLLIAPGAYLSYTHNDVEQTKDKL